MRCISIRYVALAMLGVKPVVPTRTHNLISTNVSIDRIISKLAPYNHGYVDRRDTPPPESPPGSPPSWEDEIWQTAHCRGAKLLAAMTASEEKQRKILQWPYIQSTWDGDLHKELEEWGYKDSAELHRNADIFCDFSGSFHELGTAFKAMDIDPMSAEFGGPNHCFHIEHQNGPAVLKREADGPMPEPKDQRYRVGDKEYRVSRSFGYLQQGHFTSYRPGHKRIQQDWHQRQRRHNLLSAAQKSRQSRAGLMAGS
jgi:hypothetical protein